ncbi:MAG: accessory factor UbiK family protein [Proteobacteria bacterium]|nr:accessory factor UbiK family protein [Pseudomonadota bacterium]
MAGRAGAVIVAARPRDNRNRLARAPETHQIVVSFHTGDGRAMQTDNRLFDDLARVATNALGSLQSARDEAGNRIRQQFERIVESMDLVSREEFDTVKAMAQKARLENDKLAKRIAELEAKLGIKAKPAPKSGTAKAASAKSTKAKSAKANSAKAPAQPKSAPKRPVKA